MIEYPVQEESMVLMHLSPTETKVRASSNEPNRLIKGFSLKTINNQEKSNELETILSFKETFKIIFWGHPEQNFHLSTVQMSCFCHNQFWRKIAE